MNTKTEQSLAALAALKTDATLLTENQHADPTLRRAVRRLGNRWLEQQAEIERRLETAAAMPELFYEWADGFAQAAAHLSAINDLVTATAKDIKTFPGHAANIVRNLTRGLLDGIWCSQSSSASANTMNLCRNRAAGELVQWLASALEDIEAASKGK